jgi:hypothetical protein
MNIIKGKVFEKNGVFLIEYFVNMFDGIFTYPNYYRREIEVLEEFKEKLHVGSEVDFYINEDNLKAIIV